MDTQTKIQPEKGKWYQCKSPDGSTSVVFCKGIVNSFTYDVLIQGNTDSIYISKELFEKAYQIQHEISR